MRYTIHRRTERPKTRRRRDYEVVQGPSHRFEAATPEVGKRPGVGQGTRQHRSAPNSFPRSARADHIYNELRGHKLCGLEAQCFDGVRLVLIVSCYSGGIGFGAHC
jgi:hypothetical protein